MFSTVLVADPLPGPRIEQEQAGLARVHPLTQSDQVHLPASTDHRRITGQLFVPINAPELGWTFIPRIKYSEESRSAGAQIGGQSDHRAIASSLIVAQNQKEKNSPQWFASLAHYQGTGREVRVDGMEELSIGVRVYGLLAQSSLEEAQGTVFAFRWRHFPHKDRFIPVVEHTFKGRSGTFLSLEFPSGVLVGWNSSDWSRGLYGGVELEGREYPSFNEHFKGWQEGYTTQILLGVRQHIYNPLYFTLHVGLQREFMAIYQVDGSLRSEYSTSFAPWVKVALRTFFFPKELNR